MVENSPIYCLKNIQHHYGSQKALDIERLEIQSGSITGLSGPNGSGKTSLLKLLAFVSKPSKGRIIYKNQKQISFPGKRRSQVTLLTQKPYLLKRNVFENVIYGLKIRKDMKNIEQRVADILSSVGLPYDSFANRKWHELSGGEAQRVAMAARLILRPEVLLLDEPTASVDTQSAELIRNASIQARDDWGTTLVIASHDNQWLNSACDTQLYLSDGRVFNTGIENIIPGPFEKTDHHFLIKRLGDGQVIKLRTPETDKKIAVIRRRKIFIEPKSQNDGQKRNPNFNRLTGIAQTMTLEKRTNLTMVKIAVNDLQLTLSLQPAQITHFKLYPGRQVGLAFKPEDVAWV